MRSACPFAQSLPYSVLALGINRWLQPSALSLRPSRECQEHASKKEGRRRRKRGAEKEEGWRDGVRRRKSDHQMSPKDNSPIALTGINIALCRRARPLPMWQEHSASLVHGNAPSLPFAISMALALGTGMESYLCPVAGSCVFPMEYHEISMLCRRCYSTHSRGHFSKSFIQAWVRMNNSACWGENYKVNKEKTITS